MGYVVLNPPLPLLLEDFISTLFGLGKVLLCTKGTSLHLKRRPGETSSSRRVGSPASRHSRTVKGRLSLGLLVVKKVLPALNHLRTLVPWSKMVPVKASCSFVVVLFVFVYLLLARGVLFGE